MYTYFAKAYSQEKLIPTLARHYLRGKGDVLKPQDKQKFAQLIHGHYHQVKQLGIAEQRITGQPYKTAADLFTDLKKNRTIKVSLDHNNSAVCDKETNVQYRFLHTYHHALLGADFTWQGELKACDYWSTLTDNQVLIRIFRSEIIYQAAVYFYLGKFPDTQKIILSQPF